MITVLIGAGSKGIIVIKFSLFLVITVWIGSGSKGIIVIKLGLSYS